MKTYILTADRYCDAHSLLRKLRRKKARLVKAFFIVKIDDHRKIRDAIVRGRKALILIVE